MKRRDLLSGLAMAGMELEAQQHSLRVPLYIPKPHLVEDRKLLHDFMDEFPFADLVTSSPTLRITHVPVFLGSRPGPVWQDLRSHFPPELPKVKRSTPGNPESLSFMVPIR